MLFFISPSANACCPTTRALSCPNRSVARHERQFAAVGKLLNPIGAPTRGHVARNFYFDFEAGPALDFEAGAAGVAKSGAREGPATFTFGGGGSEKRSGGLHAAIREVHNA
jgi:hypothetical protein